MELIHLVTSRPFVIALALVGAGIATVGSLMMRSGSDLSRARAGTIVNAGYGLTGLSVFLFVVAGFLSEG